MTKIASFVILVGNTRSLFMKKDRNQYWQELIFYSRALEQIRRFVGRLDYDNPIEATELFFLQQYYHLEQVKLAKQIRILKEKFFQASREYIDLLSPLLDPVLCQNAFFQNCIGNYCRYQKNYHISHIIPYEGQVVVLADSIRPICQEKILLESMGDFIFRYYERTYEEALFNGNIYYNQDLRYSFLKGSEGLITKTYQMKVQKRQNELGEVTFSIFGNRETYPLEYQDTMVGLYPDIPVNEKIQKMGERVPRSLFGFEIEDQNVMKQLVHKIDHFVPLWKENN